MGFIDPNRVRLLPGQCIEGIMEGSEEQGEVGFFMRSETGEIRRNGDLGIEQRAGVIQFNDVILVLTMLKVQGEAAEIFEIWWNYYAPDADAHFQRMSEQDLVTLHFYNEKSREFTVETENRYKKFFASVPGIMEKATPWTDTEFDRAVRGFCAQSYPRENLWDMIQMVREPEKVRTGPPGLEDYPGYIPEELRPFYEYYPDKGHCIKVISSMFEEEVLKGKAEDHLTPAPVRTVLRGGVRWVNGYPVAPIPFIPGHGLAVPPEDNEL